MDTINIKDDKELFEDWVIKIQNDMSIKCLKMNSSTAAAITANVNCIATTNKEDFLRNTGYIGIYTGITIYIDETLEDNIVKASKEG